MTTCTKCDLHKSCKNPCVWGCGNTDASVMLVGEAPGYHEDTKQTPFVGQAGQLLDHILNKLGVERDDLYMTNLIKCRPSQNTLPKKKDELHEIVSACIPYLVEEVSRVKPAVMVLLGGVPLAQLTKHRYITRCEGMQVEVSPLLFPDVKVVSCFHPAYVLRSPSKESNLARALHKAFDMAGIKVTPKGVEAGRFDYEISGI